MGYETQLREVTFRSMYDEYGANTGVLDLVSGKYTISYMMPTSGLNDLDFAAADNYYTADGYDDLEDDFVGLTGSQQASVDLILSSSSGYATFFSDVAQLAFNKKTSGTEAAIVMGQLPDDAIVFPNSPNDVGSTFFVPGNMPPSNEEAAGRFGDIWLNEDFNWSGVATPGTEAFFAILHELAHSVGALKHIDQTGDVNLIDNQQYSVLSYNPLGWTNSTTPGSAGNALYNDDETSPLYAYGLQLEDIRNLQILYGKNTATRNEDTDGDPGTTGTIYELGQGLGRGGDEDKAFITTIWDGGGEDTIDVSGFSGYRAKINLNDGAFSSIGSTGKSVGGVFRQGFGQTAGDAEERDINNVAIAYGTMIENAIGGDQDDKLTGNELENLIHGGAGADFISGGIGDDTLYGDAGNDIFHWNLGDGNDAIMDWGSGDTIQLGGGISWDMVTINTSGSHITLTIGNGVYQDSFDPGFIGTIIVVNQASNVGTFLSNVTGVTGSQEYTPTPTNTINSSSATVNGTSANDDISGGVGAQVLNGAGGDDIINVGSGDTGNGGDDRDKLTGGVSTTLNGNDGDDWLISGSTMNGGTGDDIIEGGGSIDGGAGNDYIYVSGNNANVGGGTDNDVIKVVADNTTINGEAGDDVIHLAYMFTTLSTTIVTGEGDDTIYKSGLWTVDVDWASGATLTDYVFDDETGDLVAEFAGGASTRFIDYFAAPDDWSLPLLTGSSSFTYFGNDSDEYVLGLAFHDVIEGNGGNDEIHAGVGNDEIYGGDGNDILYGDADDDLIDGGDGDDDIYAEFGNDTVKGGAGTDELFLGSGVGIGDVTLHKDGDNLVIKVNDGRTITLVDQYVNIGSAYVHAVETFDSTNLLAAMLGVNNLPQAEADAASGNEDTNITGNVLSDNGSGADSDPDSDPLIVTAASFATAHGMVAILANGNFTYTPEANYNGTDSFEYEVDDGEGGTDTATVTLTVNAVNDAPTLTNNGGSVLQDTALTLTTAMLTGADVDNTNGQLVFTVTGVPAHGALKLNGTTLNVSDTFTKQDIVDGLVTFEPTAAYHGSDDFDFTLSDGTNTLSAASFAIAVTPASVTLNGGSGADTLTGGAGDDTINGNGGDDTLYGLGGADIIHGNAGSDWIEGGDGDDVMYTEGGALDYIFGGAGNDILYNYGPVASQAALLSAGYDLNVNYYDGLFGGDGDDTIYAQYNYANLYGENGNDTMYGSSGNNHYIASDGYDVVDDEGHMDYGAGVGGTDKIYLTTASGYTYSALKFTTLNNHQDLYIWISATAATTIIGQFSGDANKVIEQVYQQATATNYTISSLSTFDILGGSGNDTLNGFDSLTFGDDTIRGNGGADTINGKGGLDWIYGGAGNDTITGGAGNDLLYGEADSDTYVFNLGDGQDTISDSGGTADKILLGSGFSLSDLVLTESGTYNLDLTFTNAPSDKITIQNFRNGSSYKIETISFNGSDVGLVYGTASSETLTGTSGTDLIYGKGGSNSINTGNGNDIIIGGDDYDDVNYTLYSYTGDKTVYGNGGDDRLTTGSGNDTIYGGSGTDTVNGLTGNDTIYGGDALDYLSGHAGNDVIYGEAGDDWVMGWIGNDILYGGDGNDEVMASHPGGYSTMAAVFGAHTGVNNSKTLYGDAGADNLYGYIGDDILVGGTGADNLTGDTGADEFVFNAGDVGTGVDTITDFSKTSGDTINLADLIEGLYDPMQHSINDFVTATSNSGNTTLAVDRDGTGSSYSSQNVVVVNGQTWTSLADMISSGDLIVQD